MLERLIDRVDAALARRARLVSILTGLAFAVECAVYAGFIRLPQIAWLQSRSAIIAVAVWNAVWWGFINPRIQRRRLARGDQAG